MKKVLSILFLSLLSFITQVEARNITYISQDDGKTWSLETGTVINNLSTKGAVDPSPILLKNNEILLYVLGSNNTSSDPGRSQPDDTWRIIVARSNDDGKSFSQVGIAYSQKEGMTDPFPLLLPTGEFKLYISQGTNVFSATSLDGITYKKDKGYRSKKKGGVPGALTLEDGSVLLFVCKRRSPKLMKTDIIYLTSKDGMKFKTGGVALKAPQETSLCDPSPVVNPSGGYSMAYKKRKPADSKDPKDDSILIADSIDGKKWITRNLTIGKGSVPGLVIDSKGVWHIYATGRIDPKNSKSQGNKKNKWNMFRKPPPKIQDCFLKFLTPEDLEILSNGMKPKNKNLLEKANQALKTCTKS
jgi:hypothetical protein